MIKLTLNSSLQLPRTLRLRACQTELDNFGPNCKLLLAGRENEHVMPLTSSKQD